MEKICRTCKYFNMGKCCNKDFQRMVSGSSAKDEFVSITEYGMLAEYIRENSKESYDLADIVVERLNDLEYIKKNKKKIWSFRDIDDREEFLNKITETMDIFISEFVLSHLKDEKMDYYVDRDFGCKFWE